MKKIFLIAAAVLIASASFAAGPNQKVLDAFNKTFQHVKDVSWQDIEDDQYEANFSQNNITYRVMYDEEGNVVKSIRYYYGQTLPIFIQAKLAKKYEGKKIFGVTEVTTENEMAYYIVLEDEKTWINVKSDSFGNMFTEKKLKKA